MVGSGMMIFIQNACAITGHQGFSTGVQGIDNGSKFARRMLNQLLSELRFGAIDFFSNRFSLGGSLLMPIFDSGTDRRSNATNDHTHQFHNIAEQNFPFVWAAGVIVENLFDFFGRQGSLQQSLNHHADRSLLGKMLDYRGEHLTIHNTEAVKRRSLGKIGIFLIIRSTDTRLDHATHPDETTQNDQQ